MIQEKIKTMTVIYKYSPCYIVLGPSDTLFVINPAACPHLRTLSAEKLYCFRASHFIAGL